VYLNWEGTLAACDGSAGSSMGAAAVLKATDGAIDTQVCKVGGEASSFRAEAAAMWQAIKHADKTRPLAVLTDSMNVINALQAWDQSEFVREMEWQRNADIIVDILLAINARAGPITIVKVKSHRGVCLNEHADVLAGAAAAADSDEVDTLFTPSPPDNQFTYSWTPEGAEEPTCTHNIKEVHKRWDGISRQQVREKVVQQGTYAGELLTHPGWGQHLLHQSRLVRPWTELEERRWLQMAGRVYPVMTYLRRIDKHPTGACPWGCKDVGGSPARETLGHFQSECEQFALNRTAAHHAIARATMAALKDMRLPNWQFFYEMPFGEMPFAFKWASEEEKEQQAKRRPDGMAWNSVTGQVLFLEFTRAMDNPDNMQAALDRKGHQYDEAVTALQAAQRNSKFKHSTTISSVNTAPLIFGVRGTVLINDAREALQALNLTGAQLKRALAQGVRAAIAGASDMCSARAAALKCLPRAPRGLDGKRVKVVIPPKPFRERGWRQDRGGGEEVSRGREEQREQQLSKGPYPPKEG
jgi:ribonuclease HI